MSIIATTNSTCTVKKIEYRGVEAIIYLNIVAFAKTSPEKGVMIYLKEPNNNILIPAFRVSSEDDVYQNKIFWINTSTLTGHTHQNIGMEATIPVHVDLSKGTYKDNHLYRNITIVITDYTDERKPLWSSAQLHLCSGPLKFDIVGNIVPNFTKLDNGDSIFKYGLSIDYKFSENSWIFNLQHEDLLMEMSVHAKQSLEFDTKEIILASTCGSWNDVSNELEETAHVTITTKLKLNNSIIWQDQITCVPGELSTLYVKKDNSIYIVSHKSLQKNTLARDTHMYHGIKTPCELVLVISPWRHANGSQRWGSNGQPLYTLTPCVQTIFGKYIPFKKLSYLPINIFKVYFNTGEELIVPSTLTGDISEDFPSIVYGNYNTDKAERLLSQMALINTSFKILIRDIVAVKQPLLLADTSPLNYSVGTKTNSGIYVGSDKHTYSLLIPKGDHSYDE